MWQHSIWYLDLNYITCIAFKQPLTPLYTRHTRYRIVHCLDLPTNGHSIRPWTHSHTSLSGTRHTHPMVLSKHQSTSLEREYLHLHQSLGHIHSDRMQLMVRQGTIPNKFKQCRLPFCASCAFGKSSRKPWHSHSSNNDNESSRPQHPGECVSVNQLISHTPGFIAKMSGTLTTQQYKCATIFVDQYSGYLFVWIQRSTSVKDTIAAKRAFEHYANTNGIDIKHYHADNGVFKATKWVANCHSQRQSISYAAVGAHHQNGVAERRIRVLKDMTRTQLLHAQERWPQAISAYIWPYALHIANENGIMLQIHGTLLS